ncbi:hypothetical protein [Parasphingorhabdus flavimaris]|uniref:hypothetical protein n=1 Tax=Parasphingorhabdus flavimaris TaxID=266812 RepID=UPI0030013363
MTKQAIRDTPVGRDRPVLGDCLDGYGTQQLGLKSGRLPFYPFDSILGEWEDIPKDISCKLAGEFGVWSESYLEGDIALKLSFKGGGSHERKCILFCVPLVNHTKISHSCLPRAAQANTFGRDIAVFENAVHAAVPELVQTPEGVAASALVWLDEIADQFTDRLALDRGLVSFEVKQDISGFISEGEFSPRWFRDITQHGRSVVNSVVERRPHFIDCVKYDDSEGGNGRIEFDLESDVARHRIDLGVRSATLSCCKSGDTVVKLVKMLGRSLQ